jgi:hypothetical protein
MDFTSLRDDWPRTRHGSPGPVVLSDDPADHGLSGAEVACIEKAYEIRRHEVRAELEKPLRFELDWALSGFGWPKTGRERAKWILVIPLVVVLLGILQVVAVPFQYVAHRREVARRKAQLRQELAELEWPPSLRPIEHKTLRDLWSVYGFERGRFPESVSVELASAWIDRLYRPEVTRAARLEARLEAINKRRAWQRAKATAVTCILFTPRLEEALKELSSELPPYDWARGTPAPGPGERVH